MLFDDLRQVHVNSPFNIHGCARAGVLTPSPLLSTYSKQFLGVAKDPLPKGCAKNESDGQKLRLR